jgi:glycosyltransferase involved in cell wall biosynthesis
MTGPRVLIVGHYASDKIGGEAAIPLHLFRRLRGRGVETWLVTHESGRDELTASLGDDVDRVVFVRSLPGFGPLLPLGERLPVAPRALAWSVTQLERQYAMLPVVRRLVRELRIDVVHQPISVSPTIGSPIRRVGAPVVMGPLNGGMDLPPAFRGRDSRGDRLRKGAAPLARRIVNRLAPGRLEAAVVLVANERTESLLPSGLQGEVRRMSDIGVTIPAQPAPAPGVQGEEPGDGYRLCFVGRLVPLKGVDLLLRAFSEVAADLPDAELEIVGDGPQRPELEELAKTLGLTGQVVFRGWLDPAGCADALERCDVFVFPSLQEAGGVAVLEAMAAGRPVIAARWGGPAELLDDDCGILVPVDSATGAAGADSAVGAGAAGFGNGLVAAMLALSADPARRRILGHSARRRAGREFDRETLVDRALHLYEELSDSPGTWAPSSRRVTIVGTDSTGRRTVSRKVT